MTDVVDPLKTVHHSKYTDPTKALTILAAIWHDPILRPPIYGHGKIRLPNTTEMRELWGYPKLEPQRNKQTLRQKFEGGNRVCHRQLLRIYTRDKGICFHCGDFVERKDASREHLFRPISQFPQFARKDEYIVLSHKRCNL